MPTEAFPTGSTYQPEDRGQPTYEQGGDVLVNYSDNQEFLGRDATKVAIEVFGKDLQRSGMFFTEAGSDLDVPYRVECRGDGNIVTFNVYRNDIYEGTPAQWRGLDGYVISAAEARTLSAGGVLGTKSSSSHV